MYLFERIDSKNDHRLKRNLSQLALIGTIGHSDNTLTVKLQNKAIIFLNLLFCLSLMATSPSFADLISPTNLQTKKGSTAAEPLAVLNIQDQTGNADDMKKYLEFEPTTKGYSGIFKFTVPSNVNQTLKSLVVHANYRGLQMSGQKWVFKLLDVQSGKWVTVADNRAATPWTWTAISKAVTGDPNRFINSNAQVSLQYLTGTNNEISQLDYLALVTTTNGTVTPPPPVAVTPTPPTPPITTNGNRWQPIIGTQWQIQYTGTIDTSLNVGVYNLDLFDTSASVISGLKAKGKHVICYFSAGSYENWRPDAGAFPASVLGRDLDGWAGEKWLDVGQLNTLIPIMKARMQLAATKGCDAVDPDNVDGYSNNTGFTLSYNDQLAYNIALAQEAHSLGLAVSLKNDLGQINDLVNYVDFAVNEECFQYNECSMLTPFINAGKPVFGIEYNLTPASFCPQANSMNFDFLKKNLSLDAARTACR